MSDVTSAFASLVQSARQLSSIQNESKDNKSRSQIMRPTKKKPPFMSAATEILESIGKLQQFLTDHRKEYLDVSKYVSSKASNMTEEERDEIDREVHATIDKCHAGIVAIEKGLVELAKKKKEDDGGLLHQIGIVEYLRDKLAEVAALFKRQKRQRLKQKLKDAEGYLMPKIISPVRSKSPIKPVKVGEASSAEVDVSSPSQEPDELQLDDSERKQFEEENVLLYGELETMVDQLRIVDTQLASVSHLFDELVTHVSEQKNTMESIHSFAVNASNHVSKANNSLITATHRTVDFRVMVLMFLVVCSIALLFLNWYEQ